MKKTHLYESIHSLNLTIFIVIALILSFAGTILANETENIADLDIQSLLDEVVLSASKHAETLEESPANVFIVTNKMIKTFGCRNISEALALVPGLYITDDYSYSQIGVHGLSFSGDWNSHVMLLIDGRPVLDQYSGSSSIDVSGLDISNIDRIEFVKGPSSTLYGSNAFLGIVNLITFTADNNSVTFNTDYFSNTKFLKNSMSLYYRFENDFEVRLSGSWADRKGNRLFFEEFSDIEDGTLFALDEEGYNQYYLDTMDFTGGYTDRRNKRENYFTHNKISWRNLSVTIHSARQKNGVSNSFYGSVFNRPENQYREEMSYVDLEYSDYVRPNLELNARLSYHHYEWADHVLYNYYSAEDEPVYLPGPVWIDLEHDLSYSAETRVKIDLTEHNTVLLGTEVQFHEIRHESGEADANGENIIENIIPAENVKYKGEIYNLYLMDEHKFSDRIKAVGGLHFNYFTYTTGKVMPKGALVIKPYAQGTWKLIASRGFRSPSFYQMTFDDGAFFIGNPDLQAELISSYEFISVHEFPYGFQADLVCNYSSISNLIIQTIIDQSDPAHPGGDYLDEISQHRNLGRIETKSIEFSLRRNAVYNLNGFANITYQNVKSLDDSQADVSFNSPSWLGNLGIAYQALPGQLSFSFKTNYISSRSLWDGETLEGQFSMDAYMNLYDLWNLADLTVGVTNIFDSDNRTPLSYDYDPSTTIPQPGRSVFINLKTTFGL